MSKLRIDGAKEEIERLIEAEDDAGFKSRKKRQKYSALVLIKGVSLFDWVNLCSKFEVINFLNRNHLDVQTRDDVSGSTWVVLVVMYTAKGANANDIEKKIVRIIGSDKEVLIDGVEIEVLE